MNLSLIVRISFTSAAPATMPLPFTLSSRLSRIRLSLWLVLLCHACTSRCVGNSCSLLRCNPSPGRRRHRLTATHVSTWLKASGHVPRSQKQLFPKLRIGGGTYDLVSQTNYWCYLYRRRSAPATNITIWATNAKRQKNLVDSRELRRA